jgi:hypothetical protein
MIKTELYFGSAMPNGDCVEESDWKRFLHQVVTLHFPEGLTWKKAHGQWRSDSTGMCVEETYILILFHEGRDREIDSIRDVYKEAFKQESVMRVDYPAVRVTF